MRQTAKWKLRRMCAGLGCISNMCYEYWFVDVDTDTHCLYLFTLYLYRGALGSVWVHDLFKLKLYYTSHGPRASAAAALEMKTRSWSIGTSCGTGWRKEYLYAEEFPFDPNTMNVQKECSFSVYKTIIKVQGWWCIQMTLGTTVDCAKAHFWVFTQNTWCKIL